MFRRIVMATMLCCLLPAPVTAQDDSIVVRAEVARTEVERILNADNVNTVSLSPRAVANTISAISRGRAPEDFWQAYQRHVDAWLRFAELTERTWMGGIGDRPSDDELAHADRAINLTFDEVERIARRYGARMPVPLTDLVQTV